MRKTASKPGSGRKGVADSAKPGYVGEAAYLPPPGEDPAFDAEWRRADRRAMASYRRHGGIPHEEVEAWVRSLGTPHELPEPKPRKL